MKTKKAFTLIELLIVIAIIGILASVALVSLSSARLKAKTAKSIAQITAIHKALEAYYVNSGSYPISSGWQGYCSAWGAELGANWIPELTVAGYFNGSLPVDPRQPSPGTCVNRQTQYIYTSDGSRYKLISVFPESMEVPTHLIDPARPNNGWGYWSSGCQGC